MTVKRVLQSLESTHPELYDAQTPSNETYRGLLSDFFVKEMEYSRTIRTMGNVTAQLCSDVLPLPHSLDCLNVYLSRIGVYHGHVIRCIEKEPSENPYTDINWDEAFAWKDNDLQVAGTGAYRSYTTEYPMIVHHLDEIRRSTRHETVLRRCSDLLKRVRIPIEHILSYQQTISSMLNIVHPVHDRSLFESLATAFLKFAALSSSILEAAYCIRTQYALRCIKQRAVAWSGPDADSLGDLLLDDCIFVKPPHLGYPEDAFTDSSSLSQESNSCFLAFAFQEALLLCQQPRLVSDDLKELCPVSDATCRYPIERWEIGPALRLEGSLSVVCAIPTCDIMRIYRPEAGSLSFDVVWEHDGTSNAISINCSEKTQLDQWIDVMKSIGPSDAMSMSLETTGEMPYILFSDVDELELRGTEGCNRSRSKAKPWSLIARRALTPPMSVYSHSEASSVSFSPIVSPMFSAFITENPITSRNFPSHLDHSEGGPISIVGNDAVDDGARVLPFGSDNKCILDLTGQVVRIDDYPAAHGGFADVWKCAWEVGTERLMVTVKVFRGKLSDEEQERKMSRRLSRELRVWMRLEHENVIPLFGTCGNFGQYMSLVCPWYENGSLHRYLLRYPEELHLSERLRLLGEIASGLAYLHSFSIVHGDLSSSNVLINDQRKACLCDFGLASVVGEFMDTTNSSVLGGAVRWAAPESYDISDRICTHAVGPRMSSDTYSYGSLALEVLSGKVPYHHLRNEGQVLIELHKKVKPPRPSSTYLTDDLWDFIQRCWNDDPTARPTSVDVFSEIHQFRQRILI